MKFLEPDRKPQVIYIDNSPELGKACEDLSWNHCTSTLHRSETNGIAERAVRRVKEGTSAVLLQSGLNESTPICETSQISYLMGRRPMKDVLGNHLKDRLLHLVHWLSTILLLRRTSQESIYLERKVLPGKFLGFALHAGGIWKGDITVADVEELEEMDASKLDARRLSAKEVLTPQWSGRFICPVAHETAKIFGENSVWEHPPWPGSDWSEVKNNKF